MNTNLNDLLKLKNQVVDKQSDSIIIKIILDSENQTIIRNFYDDDLLESIKNGDEIVNIEQLSNFVSKTLLLEFVTAELKKIGFYVELNDFICSNRFDIPSLFYISEIDYSNDSEITNDKLNKYKTLTNLINKLQSKAKFISEEDVKTFYIVQENSFIDLPVDNIVYEDFLNFEDLTLVDDYIENIESYKEKRSIFLKELIDYLTQIKSIERVRYLLSDFKFFYERCNTSYEYYLSNFSFNKVKLELDNSVLEHSKNIRSIINDSQTKLIAIPAAFVLTASQIDFADPFCLKNSIVLISSFMFSYIVSIFIENQKNALEIVHDNVNSYKNNYKRSKENIFESEKELVTLTALISNSYIKTDDELKRQKNRLKVLQICTWGISLALFATLIIIKYLPNIKQFWALFISSWQLCGCSR